MWAGSYPSRALCASASTSSVDIAVMSWAVANGLLRSQTVGDAFRWPIGRAVTTDIDDWQVRNEFSRATGNLPAVRSSAQIDIGYKATKTRRIGFEFAQRLSALRYVADTEPGLYKTFFQIVPDEPLVLHQQKRLCRRHPLAFSSTPSTRTANTQD